MVVINPFAILFDNPSAIFRPGDTISGVLNIGFGEPTKLRSKFLTTVKLYGREGHPR